MIGELRARHPETVLVAEAYWDMEWVLQRQGFNFCYDKRLYDRIIGGDASAVRDHLHADLSYQSRLLRFLENHDEPRIASRLAGAPERAAAVSVATLPGAILWHEGQFEGRRVRPPVFLPAVLTSRPTPSSLTGTGACWPPWATTRYGRVRGDCTRCGWPDNQSCRNLVAWSWAGDRGDGRHLVVVNLSGQPAQGQIPLDWPDLPGRNWWPTDIFGKQVFERDGDELATTGLFVDLESWQFYVLALR